MIALSVAMLAFFRRKRLDLELMELKFGNLAGSPTLRQPDRRRRSRRAAGLRRQGAGRERARRRRPPHRHHRRARRQEADSRRRRRRGHGSRRRAAGDRAARDQQDRARRGPRRDPTLGLPRRGAAEHRVGLALHAAHARPRARQSGTEIKVNAGDDRVGPRSRRARGHLHRGRRSLLQPAGAAEVPQVRHRRDDADLAARRRSWRSAIPKSASPSSAAAARCCSARRRQACASGSFSCTASARTWSKCRKEAGGLQIEGLRRRARRPGADARRAERLRQPPHRQGPHDRARDHRGLQRRDDQGAQPRGPPVPAHRARSRGRQRPPDEGGSAIPRGLAGARGPAPRARRRARRRAGRPSCSSRPTPLR